jgi:superfamily II DNA/RNA helicase
MLSATPFVNNFTDFVPIINMLYGGELLGVNKDFSKYWKVSEGVSNERFNNNLEKIGKYLKDRIDYFPTDYTDENFPQIREEKKYVEMKREYLQPYTELLKGSAEDLTKIYYVLNPGDNPDFDENESFKIVFDNPAVFYNGCRRLVNTLYKSPGTLEEFYLLEIYISEKINQAISIIKNNKSKKTIIYTNWINQGIEPIKTVLNNNGYKGKYQIYTGSISMEERDDIVKKYNDPSELGAEILIMSSAGSEGIDLKFTNNVIVIDPPWNKANLEQIVGRAARYKSHEGLEDKFVNVYYMILTTPAETNQLIAENKLIETAEEKSDDSNQIKLGDVLLYDIIEEKNKTTIEVNKVFRQICINSTLIPSEEYTALPIIDTTTPDQILEDKLQRIATEEPAKQHIIQIESKLAAEEPAKQHIIQIESKLAAEEPAKQHIIQIESKLAAKKEISEAKNDPRETLTEEDYLQMFKEFINKEDIDRLKDFTMKKLKKEISNCYKIDRKSKTFKSAYNNNEQEILQCIRTKLYPETART